MPRTYDDRIYVDYTELTEPNKFTEEQIKTINENHRTSDGCVCDFNTIFRDSLEICVYNGSHSKLKVFPTAYVGITAISTDAKSNTECFLRLKSLGWVLYSNRLRPPKANLSLFPVSDKTEAAFSAALAAEGVVVINKQASTRTTFRGNKNTVYVISFAGKLESKSKVKFRFTCTKDDCRVPLTRILKLNEFPINISRVKYIERNFFIKSEESHYLLMKKKSPLVLPKEDADESEEYQIEDELTSTLGKTICDRESIDKIVAELTKHFDIKLKLRS